MVKCLLGSCVRVVRDAALSPPQAQLHVRRIEPPLGPLESFGDAALLFCMPRGASVVAEEGAELVSIDRAHYAAIVQRGSGAGKARERAAFLSSLPIFSQLHLQHVVSVAVCATTRKRERRAAGSARARARAC